MLNSSDIDAQIQELDKGILEAKQALFRLMRKQETSLDENRIFHFVPSPKQEEFIKNSEKKVRAIFAGNRFGKSTLGVVEDVSWLLGYRPWLPESDPLRTAGIPAHGVKGLVLAEDWDKVREIFTEDQLKGDRRGKFFQFLPPWAISRIRRNQNGVIDMIAVVSELNGRKRESVVYFDTVKSYKNNRMSAESSDWDFIHADEPIPQSLWIAVSRGLIDRGGATWWLLTPLSEPWMYTSITSETVNTDYTWYTVADMDDNPLLSKEAKERFLVNLTEDERLCRQKGIPLAFGNLVYPHYNEDVHLVRTKPKGWPTYNVPPYEYATGYAIDPHPQTPHAVLFCTIAPTGQVYWYDEIFAKSRISELAELILEKIKNVRVCWELCDPIAWIEDPETGECWASILQRYGLNVEKATKAKTAGIIQTRDKWAGDQRMFVMEHMKVFRKEIKNYFFDKENKPVDKNDHMMECMYRTVMHNDLQFIEFNDDPVPYLPQDDFSINVDEALNEFSISYDL